jgi:predicted aspartyl protease
MGFTYDEFKLINIKDVSDLRRGRIQPSELRVATVSFLIDTGAYSTFVTDEIKEQLGLYVVHDTVVKVGGGELKRAKVLSPVSLLWKTREKTIDPLLLPGQKQPVMGVLALEALDLMVDPVTQKLRGINGDEQFDYLI